MNARGKEHEYVNANELPIILETAPSRINYQKTSGLILTACRSFYTEPENEKAYREWQAERSGKNEQAV